MDLFDLFIKLSLDDSEFDKGLDEVQNKIKSFSGVATAIGAATATVTATVAAIKAVGEAVVQGTAELAQYGDHIDKMSQKMGMSAEAFQEWDAVMQHSGTSMETLKASMKTLANAAQTGSDAFDKLGISQEQIASMSQEELFSATITALQNVEDETERTYLASKTLGRGATELGALLNTSAEETQRMKDRVHELGGVLSDEAVKASAQFQDNLQDMTTTIDGIKRSVEAGFLPAMNLLMEGFTSLVANEEGAEEKLSQGFDKLLDGFEGAVEKLEPIAKELIPRLVDFIAQSFPRLAELSVDIVDMLVNAILDNLPNITTAAIEVVTTLVNGITNMLPELIPAAVEAVLQIAEALIDNLDIIVDAAIELITALSDGLIQSLPVLIEKAPEIIIKLGTALVKNLDKLKNLPQKIFKTIADGLVHIDWRETAEKMMDGLIGALDGAIKQVQVWIDSATAFLTGQESKYGGDIANVPTSEFVSWMQAGKDDVVDAIGDAADGIAEGYDAFYNTVEKGTKKAGEAYYNMSSEMNDYAKSLQAQAENWKKSSSALAQAVVEAEEEEKKLEARLKARFQELETQMLEQGLSEEWLVHQERAFLETLNHGTELYKEYNLKMLKEEQKITKAADAEKKKSVEKWFAQLEAEALKNGYTEQWLVEQERAYIEALDHSTELYEEYNLKLLRAEKKVNDDIVKQREKQAQDAAKSFKSSMDNMIKSAKDKISEYQKALDNIKSSMKDFAKTLVGTYTDMFSFDVDEKTGKVTATKTKDYLDNATKELERYYKNIQKLRERGVSDTMLNQLQSMDATQGAAVARYWASLSDAQLKEFDKNWQRYEAAGQKVSAELYSDEIQDAEQKLSTERNTLLSEILEAIRENSTDLMNGFAPAGDITINVAGQQAIRTTITDVMRMLKNSGGVLDV